MELYYNYNNPEERKLINLNQTIETLGFKNNDIVIIQPENINLIALIKPSNKKIKVEVTGDW